MSNKYMDAPISQEEINKILDADGMLLKMLHLIDNECDTLSWFDVRVFPLYVDETFRIPSLERLKVDKCLGVYLPYKRAVIINVAKLVKSIKKQCNSVEGGITMGDFLFVICKVVEIVVAHENRHIQQYKYLMHTMHVDLDELADILSINPVIDKEKGEDIMERDARNYSMDARNSSPFVNTNLGEALRPYIDRKVAGYLTA